MRKGTPASGDEEEIPVRVWTVRGMATTKTCSGIVIGPPGSSETFE
jgi:hypothetical protein